LIRHYAVTSGVRAYHRRRGRLSSSPRDGSFHAADQRIRDRIRRGSGSVAVSLPCRGTDPPAGSGLRRLNLKRIVTGRNRAWRADGP